MGTSIMGTGGMNAQASIQQAKESQLLQQMKLANGPDQTAKIEKGSKQFEAMLLSTWLQQAEESFASVPGADDDEDAQTRNQMLSLGVQSLSESLAASGGIGIGAMIAKSMEAAASKANAQATSETPQTKQKEILTRNLKFSLNSKVESADRVADSQKGLK